MKAYLHEALIDIEYVTNFMAKISTYQEGPCCKVSRRFGEIFQRFFVNMVIWCSEIILPRLHFC